MYTFNITTKYFSFYSAKYRIIFFAFALDFTYYKYFDKNKFIIILDTKINDFFQINMYVTSVTKRYN